MLETPQNNFVVFNSDGVFLNERPMPDTELIGLVDAVITDHLSLIARIQRAQRMTNLTLSRVQDLLDEIDTENWKAFVADPLSAEITQRIISTTSPPCVLQDFPECLRNPETFATTSTDHVAIETRPAEQVSDPVEMLRLMLLEMTARDVSLMITFIADHDDLSSLAVEG